MVHRQVYTIGQVFDGSAGLFLIIHGVIESLGTGGSGYVVGVFHPQGSSLAVVDLLKGCRLHRSGHIADGRCGIGCFGRVIALGPRNATDLDQIGNTPINREIISVFVGDLDLEPGQTFRVLRGVSFSILSAYNDAGCRLLGRRNGTLVHESSLDGTRFRRFQVNERPRHLRIDVAYQSSGIA